MKKLPPAFIALTAIVQFSFSQVPTDSLVAYYPFSGNANDASGNGHDGTIFGATLATDRFGNPNSCYYFSNQSYISVPHDTVFNVTGNMTISAWYKTDLSSPNYMTILAKRPGNATFWELTIQYFSQQIGYFLFNDFSNLDYHLSAGLTSFHIWQHVVTVIRNDSSFIWIDGKLDSGEKITIPRPVNTSPITIGDARVGNNEWFIGWIDDIRIYNRALADSEIALLHHEGGWDSLSEGLLANYPFSGNAGDSSGNGNNGTVNGATLATDRFSNADKSYRFDGTANYIEIPDAPSLRPTTALTISAWIDLDSGVVRDSKTVVSKGATPGVNGDWTMIVDNTNPIGSMRIRPHMWLSNTWEYFNGSTDLQPLKWYHLVMTYDGTTMKSYVNGVNDGSLTVSGAIKTSTEPVLIGVYNIATTPAWFPGLIDDIRIYNRALSDVEIGLLYHLGGWGPLPIQLTSFTALGGIGDSIRLAWKTFSEINNYGFYIQRRGLKDKQFSDVAGSFVPGHGSTGQMHSYDVDITEHSSGVVQYRLKQIDLDGTFHYSEAVKIDLAESQNTNVPPSTELSQNYPNPFNPTTTLRYGLSQTSRVKLAIYNTLGQIVAILVNGTEEAGYHDVKFDGSGLASGVYIYRMQTGIFVQTKKLILIR